MAIKLIVGLGNIGAEYEATRHNAGFWLVDALALASSVSLRAEKGFFGGHDEKGPDSRQGLVELCGTQCPRQ